MGKGGFETDGFHMSSEHSKVTKMEDSVSLNIEGAERPVAILGSGNYGRALAKRCQMSGVKYVIGSRRSERLQKNLESKNFASYEEAVSQEDIVIFAIPRHAYDETVAKLKEHLSGKIIIDVSNLDKKSDPSNAIYLQSQLPKSDVVKALNTISAYTLENDSYGAARNTFVCGNNRNSRDAVMQFLQDIGLNAMYRGKLNSAKAIERMPFKFFENWGNAFIITLCVLVLCLLYYYLRLFWANSDKVEKEKDKLPLYHANRVIAWLALWLLALVYLPGCIAGYIQLVWGTKYKSFPGWMDRWMKCRKQVGLIVLMLAGFHACISCILMGAEYMIYMMKRVYIPNSPLYLMRHLEVHAEVSILFAAVAMTLLCVVGVTSLPSVAANMSWKEWDFIQRGVGFGSLIFAFLHCAVYVHKLYDPNGKYNWAPYWKYNIPPAAFVMPMLPALVILLKIGLLLPGVVCYFDRIRAGKVGNTYQKVVIA